MSDLCETCGVGYYLPSGPCDHCDSAKPGSALAALPMSIHREFQDKHPALASAYRKVMNKHFTAAADEHREGASDASVKRHDDEFRAAEDEFIAAMLRALTGAP